MISVCIPVLNAYDDLWRCIDSLDKSSVSCKVYIVDNGGRLPRSNYVDMNNLYQPGGNIGVAASWNYFIQHTNSPRIITNDDIIFDKYAIERMLEGADERCVNGPENLESVFSCFYLPQTIIEQVGKFDEWISPRYGYFEDNDYSYRLSLAGFGSKKVQGSLVEHVGSSTLKHYNHTDEFTHHDRFRLARQHYIQKWGGEPGEEKYKTPFGR